MFHIDLEVFVVLYVSVGLALFFFLWVLYDTRQARRYAALRRSAVFHCIKCGTIYTSPRPEKPAACPQCRFENARLEF